MIRKTVMLSLLTLFFALLSAAAVQAEGSWVRPLAVNTKDGRIEVDWANDQALLGSSYQLYWKFEGNPFVQSRTISPSIHHASIAAVPDETCAVALYCLPEGADFPTMDIDMAVSVTSKSADHGAYSLSGTGWVNGTEYSYWFFTHSDSMNVWPINFVLRTPEGWRFTLSSSLVIIKGENKISQGEISLQSMLDEYALYREGPLEGNAALEVYLGDFLFETLQIAGKTLSSERTFATPDAAGLLGGTDAPTTPSPRPTATPAPTSVPTKTPTPKPALKPTAAPTAAPQYDIPDAFEYMSWYQVYAGEHGHFNSSKFRSEQNYYSYTSSGANDELGNMLMFAMTLEHPFTLVDTQTQDFTRQADPQKHVHYFLAYTGSKSVKPLQVMSAPKTKGTYHVDLVVTHYYQRGYSTLYIYITPGLTYGGAENAVLFHERYYDRSSREIHTGGTTPAPQPTAAQRTKHCTRCGGSGKVTCTACDGRGYRIQYVSVPNYSGKGTAMKEQRENCSKCGGSGKVNCGTCGGSGKVSY